MSPAEKLPLVTPASQAGVLSVSAEKSARGVDGAMATVLARHGSAPATPGQKLYLANDGTCVGTVGGGAIEREVLSALWRMCEGESARTHEVREFRLGPELGMCCGGRAEVLIEPIDGLLPCLIVGAGHVATATAPLLAKVGYAVTVVDAREAWAGEGRIPGITMVEGEYDVLMNDFPTRGALLVMTHDHGERSARPGVAERASPTSRRRFSAKAERTRQRLEAKGFAAADRERIRMPIGAPINARLPDEIAVAIAAEMVAWKRRGEAGVCRQWMHVSPAQVREKTPGVAGRQSARARNIAGIWLARDVLPSWERERRGKLAVLRRGRVVRAQRFRRRAFHRHHRSPPSGRELG